MNRSVNSIFNYEILFFSLGNKRLLSIIIAIWPLLTNAQNYSGRRVDNDSSSSFGVVLLIIIIVVAGYFAFLYLTSLIGGYSEKRRIKKIQKEKVMKERQLEYDKNWVLYETKKLEEQIEKNKEPEFMGIGCGCWGFITAFVLIIIPAIVQTCN